MKSTKTSSRRTHRLPLWLAAAAACLMGGAESFAPLRPFARPSVPAGPLHLESLGGAPSQQSSPSAPSWIDLPGRREPPQPQLPAAAFGTAPGPAEPRERRLDGVELAVGRVAIFGATGILVKELLTGESILDQCGDMLRGWCLSS